MPRLATDTSSSRRHNAQAVSGHHHSRLHTRSTRVDSLKRGESSSTSSAESSDHVDDCYDQSQASSSRTRWNARTSGNPYASRLLSKHGPAESEDLEEVYMHLNSAQERSVDDEGKEQGSERAVSSEDGVKGAVEGDENGKADALRGQPEVGTDATMRDESKKKRTKARANANETVFTTAPDALALPPQDLLVSISRIAKLTDSLTSGASASDPTALPRWVQEAFKSDGPASSPEQWRADVLQSIRRVEGMLGRMVSEQLKVGQAEIEALREETARLEVRVRAVVEQQEVERLTRGAPLETVLQAGTNFTDSDGNLSDSAPDSNACPSDSDTGPTEPDADDRSLLELKVVQVEPAATASSPSSTSSFPAPPVECTPSPESEAHAQSSDALPRTNQNAPSYASKNLNVPPEPPEDPVEYLTKHPWSMLEVFLLLEVVAHFPAAEHGWSFVAEAYNNILITRPLQEWFSQQTAISNQEEAKMKTLLQKMNAEARRLRTPPAASAPAKTPAAASGPKAYAGETATFGSVGAHTEATARAKSATHTTGATSPVSSNPTGTITVAAKDAQIVTRLPFPLDNRSPASGPPSSQCIVPFPRRRPPFTLPSADAREFTRIMQSAAADVRPPSTESRAAMLSLYSSTKSRFSTRTSWDCWHRWCTPWVVQAKPAEKPGQSPSVVVADYIVGNLGAPCGTSAMMRTSMFEYRPVPGTYPDAPGVQHRVTARYDPRPGMVSFARMTHITAENHWSDTGLGRGVGGLLTEEALKGRRARLPATLAGIWPGKASPLPKRPAGARPPQAAASSSSTAPATSAKAATSTRGTHGTVKSGVPVAAGASGSPASATPTTSASTPRPSSAAAPAPTSARPQPRQGATGTTTHPQPPFVALPLPRKAPARDPPCVPEGTLGNRVRPGIRPWFDHAAVRVHVLERLTCVRARALVFEDAFLKSATELSDGCDSEVVGRESRTEEEERGVWVPQHLRKVVIPPPVRMVSASVSV